MVRKARKEKPEGLFICEDLSQATLEKRKPQLEKLKAAKQAGKSACLILDRLIIRDIQMLKISTFIYCFCSTSLNYGLVI